VVWQHSILHLWPSVYVLFIIDILSVVVLSVVVLSVVVLSIIDVLSIVVLSVVVLSHCRFVSLLFCPLSFCRVVVSSVVVLSVVILSRCLFTCPSEFECSTDLQTEVGVADFDLPSCWSSGSPLFTYLTGRPHTHDPPCKQGFWLAAIISTSRDSVPLTGLRGFPLSGHINLLP